MLRSSGAMSCGLRTLLRFGRLDGWTSGDSGRPAILGGVVSRRRTAGCALTAGNAVLQQFAIDGARFQ
jgi:hypothetical protein